MKTHLSPTPKFGLFFAVAFLALQATPALPADSAGSGTFVGADGSVGVSFTFKDVYAFRAEDRSDKTKQVTVVLLSELPMDKKAMTAALKKEPDFWGALSATLNRMTYATFDIDKDGEIKNFYLFNKSKQSAYNQSSGGKSEVKVNTAKRVAGRFSMGEKKSMAGYDVQKIDLRFATDLAEIGAPVKNW